MNSVGSTIGVLADGLGVIAAADGVGVTAAADRVGVGVATGRLGATDSTADGVAADTAGAKAGDAPALTIPQVNPAISAVHSALAERRIAVEGFRRGPA